MKNTNIVRAVALFVCLAILGLSAPGLLASDKRAASFEVRQFLLKPWMLLTSVFPGLIQVFDRTPGTAVAPSDNSGSGAVVKPTGDILPGRPSGED